MTAPQSYDEALDVAADAYLAGLDESAQVAADVDAAPPLTAEQNVRLRAALSP